MSRTLSGLFLVGAVNGPRKRKGTNWESPRTIPCSANRENPGKIGKVPKRTKKEGQVHIGKPPHKKLCDKDLAERSGELSGAICLKPLF